jgi:hypothetical protein
MLAAWRRSLLNLPRRGVQFASDQDYPVIAVPETVQFSGLLMS